MIDFHGPSEIFRGYRSSCGLTLAGFNLTHVKHFEIYSLMSLERPGQQKVFLMREDIFDCLGCPASIWS